MGIHSKNPLFSGGGLSYFAKCTHKTIINSMGYNIEQAQIYLPVEIQQMLKGSRKIRIRLL